MALHFPVKLSPPLLALVNALGIDPTAMGSLSLAGF